MNKWSEKITLDEYFYDEELDSTVIYFNGPIELLEQPNKDDVGSEIRIEYAYYGIPDDLLECDIMIAHVMEKDNIMSDYDWDFFDITQEQYDELKDIYLTNKVASSD